MTVKADWLTGDTYAAADANAIASEVNALGANNSVTKARMADDAVGWAELDATGTPDTTTFLKVAADGALSAATPVTAPVTGSVNGTPTALTLWKGSAAQYAAVDPKDANTVYVVTI